MVEDFEGRFCGAVVAVEPGSVTLEDRFGKRRVFPLPGTFLLDGKRVTLVRPAPKQQPERRDRAPDRVRVRSPRRSSGPRSPGPAGSTSRASTTRSWWRRSGETTCATSGSSSSTWRASTTCRPSSATSSRARAGGSACSSTTSSRAPRRAGSRPPSASDPQRARRRPPVHRHLGRRQAGRGSAWRPGPTCRAGCRGRKACWPGSAGRTRRRRTWRPRGGASCGAVSSYADLEPELLGRVEELIDFVTAEG